MIGKLKKIIYKLRYILIIGSALLGLLGASGTFGYNVIENCYTNAGISPYTVRCVEFEPGDSITYDGLLNSVDNLLNFKFDDLYKFFYTSGYSYNISNSIFWNNSGKLNLMYQGNYGGMKLYEYSGLCYSESTDPSVFGSECSSVSRPCVSTVNISIDDFYTYGASHYINKVYYLPATRCINGGCSSKFNGDSLCLVYDDGTYCFTMASTVGCSAGNNIFSAITEINNVCSTNGNCLEELTNLGYVGDSIFVGGGGGGSASYTGYDISNKLLLRSYEEIGYNKNVCYGGVIKSDYSAFIPGTGLSLFQLYDQFSGGFSNILDWYNYYRDGYINYPRIGDSGSVFNIDGVFQTPLYGLFYLASLNGVSLFPSVDIIDYCDLLLNKCSDLESETCKGLYTGDKTGLDSFLSWQGKFSYKLSGNQIVFDSDIFNVLSGENKDFDPSSFFADLLTKFESGLSSLDVSVVGIVPGYILAFMFALILIRMLSK